ncbi:MAG: hypothetical protein KGI08_07695 [Thaumarchaeota archaeon]|nr:hypothetical protein [Nitrososphaerota archaeon]
MNRDQEKAMFAKSKTGPGIRKKQIDNQKPKMRFKKAKLRLKTNPRQIIINGEKIDGHSLTENEVKSIWKTMDEEQRYEAYLAGLQDELPDAHFPQDQRTRARLASKVSDIDKLETTKVAGNETLGKYYAEFGIRYGKNGQEGLWQHYTNVIRPYTEKDYAHYYNHLLDSMMRGDLGWFKGDFSSSELAYYQGTPFEKLKESEKNHAKKEIKELMDDYYYEFPETRNLDYRDQYINLFP